MGQGFFQTKRLHPPGWSWCGLGGAGSSALPLLSFKESPLPYLSNNELKQVLADALNLAGVSGLQDYWDTIVAKANLSAQGDILQALVGRGFTSAQVESWRDLAGYNADQGLFWCLVRGAGLHDYSDVFINKLDRRKDLLTVTPLDSANVAVGENSGDVVGQGELSNDNDLFVDHVTGGFKQF